MGTQPEEQTFPKLLLRNAKTFAGLPAIREKHRGVWRTQTWQDVQQEVVQLAGALQTRGLQSGAHVALIGDCRPFLFNAIAAVQALGAIAAPLYQTADAQEIAVWLNALAPTHVIAENQEQVDKVLKILGGCPSIACIVYDHERGMRNYDLPGLTSRTALMNDTQSRFDLAAAALAIAPQQPAFVFFTAGTAGPAQGVIHSHASLIKRADAVIQNEKYDQTDATMAYLSPGWACQMFYSYVMSMASGMCICCPESSDTFLDNLRETAPTRLLTTPRVLDRIKRQVDMRIADTGGMKQRLYQKSMTTARETGRKVSFWQNILLNAPLRDSLGMTRIKSMFVAGDMINPDVATFYRALDVKLHKIYGTTETSYYDAISRQGAQDGDSIGDPTPNAEIKVSDGGEVMVRSNGMFLGYLGDVSASQAAVTPAGWFKTGDFGVASGNGAIRIVDRMSDIGTFSDGGFLSPKQAERRLVGFAEISEAIVFGHGRDSVCALIDLDTAIVARWADRNEVSFTSHADLAAQEIVRNLIGERIAALNEILSRTDGLASHQISRFVLLPDPLTPQSGMLTPTGKVRRSAVADRFKSVIDALYRGETEVRFHSGEAGVAPFTLHLLTAKTTAAKGRKAA